MNITRFAIDNKRITIVVLLLILVIGISTYINMPRDEDPGFTIRTAMIVTQFPGASPERVELLVTDKLEKEIQEMVEIDEIRSISKPGVSIVYVDIKETYTVMRPIWDSLRRKVDNAKQDLPSDVIGPFVNDEFGDVFGSVIALTGEGYTYFELKEIVDDVRNELLLIDEAVKVSIFGDQEERVFVEFNNAYLTELGISPGQLKNILSSRNIIFPGGEIFTSDEQIILEPSGNFESIEELKKTVIQLPGKPDLIYLGDVATIKRGYVDPADSKVTYNGKPSLVLAVSLREGGNIIQLGAEVREKIDRFQQVYPIGVDFNILYYQADFVEKKISEFANNLIQAIMIVVIVMLIFLGVRTGLVIASLVPMAIVMAIMIMGFMDIGLDQMSLAALIIALGMLVDNAIVMSESIMTQMAEGKRAIDAAIDSANELRVSLLTSSLTTAAAFLPIYLAESAVGEYTSPIFLVVTITLLSSWVLALTMIPLLCVIFLRVQKKSDNKSYNSPFYNWYRNTLSLLLRHPYLSVVSTVLIFIASLQLIPYIPSIFFPPNDKPVMFLEVKLPVGSPLEKTERVSNKIGDFIKENITAEYDENNKIVKHGVVNYATFIGAGSPRFQLPYNPEASSPEYAYSLINVTDRWKMDTDFIPALETFCWDNFPDISVTAAPLLLGPPVAAPIQIRITGKDADQVFKIVNTVKEQLGNIPGTKNIRDNWGHRTKKLLVKINQPRAHRAGLTSEDIAISLQTVLSGFTTTDYREGDDVIPVVMRSVAADRKDIGKLESHNIYVQSTGEAVPLKQVADIEVVFQPSKILRRGRLKSVTVGAHLEPGYNAIAIANEMEIWLSNAQDTWPIGYQYEQGGELESSGESSASIVEKVPIGILIILLLLVWQFDSIRRTTIVLCTVPLGLIGVLISLVVTQQPLGFMAMLGVIALSGIVINNAIVLIDRIKIEEEENSHETPRAIIEAAQRRLRPILLTTATTMGGLIPLWLGGGAMFEAMAVVILFGLMFATLLTLGFVPVLYTIFFRVKFKDFTY